VTECVEIGVALASGLAHLHNHGLVHRDIKPSNIIFVGGAPKLADIGLVTDADTTLSYVGTEGYIPPEGPGAVQADIFSLGKVLYEMSTGQDRRQFPDLPANLKEWPDQAGVLELNEVLVKACARDARSRYQSCEEMQTDLALLQRGESVKRKRAFHHWLSVSKRAGLAVSLIAVVVVAALFLRQSPRDPYLHSAIPGVDKLVEQGNSVLQARSAERIRTALGYYNEAIQLDPNFVPAQFGVFLTLVHRGADQRGAPEEVRREHRAVAKKLMEMDSNLAEARVASAMLKWIDWQFPEALEEAHLATQKRAASKEGKAAAHNGYGYLLLQSGKPDEALEQYRLAEEKSPSGAMMQHHLGHPYFVKRDFAQALKHYRESLRLAPAQGNAHYFIGRVYEEQTNFVAAIQEFEERERLDGEYNAERKAFYDELREAIRLGGAEGYWRKRLDIALGKSQPDLYYIATLYARLGEKDKAYAYLKEACEKRAFDKGLMFDLCWDHNDEQFKAIARGIRLLQ
jgi:tetratricopeptide (TPR) repeat protein